MTVAAMRETGATDNGMDLEEQPLPMATHMREIIEWIDVMDVASIVGPMDGSIKANSVKICATEKEPLNGPVVTSI